MSVPTYYVCPYLSCLSPPFMSVPTYHVCPNLLCLSPPFISVPAYCHTQLHLGFSAKLRIFASFSLQDGATKWQYNHDIPTYMPPNHINFLLEILCPPPQWALVRTWPLEYIPRVSTGKASGVGFEKVIGYYFTLMVATTIFYWK